MQKLKTLFLATLFSFAFGHAQAATDTVNIYNWSDYIGETTLADFTAATKLRTNYDVYDNNDILEAKMLAGRSGFDIVVPTSQPYFARMVQAGLFRSLDRSKIPNWSKLDPQLMKFVETSDPGNKYGVIYQWGTNGFAYNVDAIKKRLPNAPVDSWRMIFDPEIVKNFADCGVSMLNAATEIMPLALHYLGRDPNSEKPEDLKAAIELLNKVRPYIKYFHSSNYINDLASGNLCLSVGWSGDAVQAKTRAEEAKNNIKIQYVIPKEGTLLWFDMMAIPADAPNPDGAYAYINFVLAPENMAKITNFVAYGNAVPDSLPMVDEAIRTDPSTFPSAEVRAKMFTLTQASPAFERQRTRAWTRITAGQ